MVRRRCAVPSPGGVLDVDLARHRVDRVDAAPARRALRPVRDRARDEPLPRAGRDPPRARPAARDARGRLDPRRRARQAASGEDVGGRRGRPPDAAAARPVAPRRRLACRAVPGAAAGLRAEQRARDRVDARRRGDRYPRGARARAVLHRRATRGSTSTTRRTSRGRSSSSPTAGRNSWPSRASRILAGREARLARDAVLRRRLAAVALRQGDDGRRARRLVGGDRLSRVADGAWQASSPISRRSSSAAIRARSRRSTGISTGGRARAPARSCRRRSAGSRTRCST